MTQRIVYISDTPSTDIQRSIDHAFSDINVISISPSDIPDNLPENSEKHIATIINTGNSRDNNRIVNAANKKYSLRDIFIIADTTKPNNICRSLKNKNIHLLPETANDLTSQLINYIKGVKIESANRDLCGTSNDEYTTLLKQLRKANRINDGEDEIEKVVECIRALDSILTYDECMLTLNLHDKTNTEEIRYITPTDHSDPLGGTVTIPDRLIEGVKETRDRKTTKDITGYYDIHQRVSSAETHIIKQIATKHELIGHIHLIDQKISNTQPTHQEKELIAITLNIIKSIIRADKTREELKRKIDKLEKFRYIISHDIMSPLSTAKGGINIYIQDGREDFLEKAHDAIHRMENMIKGTQRLMSAGESTDSSKQVSVPNIARNAWRVVETKEATLHVEDNIKIYADPDQLTSLFENLIKNSVEHGGEDVKIRISEKIAPGTTTRTDPSRDRTIVFEDNGNGIPDNIKENMFEERVSTKEDTKASGFGMAIVKLIVDAHGWKIEVGDSVTNGARFKISGIS